MRFRTWNLPIGAFILANALLVVSCATNPVTGRTELMLVSPQQEIEIGRRAHAQTLEQFGAYDEIPALTERVQQVGRSLAARTERPQGPWTFTILDTSMVNAMALPGGYVYVTRGMLERINSTDELAGVLGHEMAHVTARHTAQRLSRAQLAELGLAVGAVAAGPDAVERWGGLVTLGTELLFQKYSRGQETQADLLGTDYASKAGFNPIGAERLLETLQRMEPADSGSGFERYFQSHPDPAKRVRDVETEVGRLAATDPSIVQRPIERRPFVPLLDGMVTGPGTSRVVIRDNTVMEREWGIVLRYPSGWTASAGLGSLFDLTSKPAAAGQISVSESPLSELGGKSPREALRAQLTEAGLQYVTATEARARTGERFTVDSWSAETRSGSFTVEATTLVRGEKALVIVELSPRSADRTSALRDTLRALAFDPARARAAKSPRLRIRRSVAGDTWASLARRATGRESDAREVALINGFDAGTKVPTGILVKLPEQIAGE